MASLYYFAAAALFLTVQAQCPQHVAQFPSEAQGSGLLPANTFDSILASTADSVAGLGRLTVKNSSVVLSVGPFGAALELCATVLQVTPNSATAVFALSNRPRVLFGVPAPPSDPTVTAQDYIVCLYLEWTTQEPRVMNYTQVFSWMAPAWNRQLFPTDGAIVSPLSRCGATPDDTTLLLPGAVAIDNALLTEWVPWYGADLMKDSGTPALGDPPMPLPLGSGTACPRLLEVAGVFDTPIAEFPPLLRGSTVLAATPGVAVGTCPARPARLLVIGDSGVSVTTPPTPVTCGYVVHACLSSITPVAQLVDTSPGANFEWAAQGYEVQLSSFRPPELSQCMWIVPSRPLWQQSDLQPVAPQQAPAAARRLRPQGQLGEPGFGAQGQGYSPARSSGDSGSDVAVGGGRVALQLPQGIVAGGGVAAKRRQQDVAEDDPSASSDDPYGGGEDIYDGELLLVIGTPVNSATCPSSLLQVFTISERRCAMSSEPLWCVVTVESSSNFAGCSIARGTRFWYDGRGLPPTDPVMAESVAAESVLWEQGVLTSPLPTPSAFSSPSASITPSGSGSSSATASSSSSASVPPSSSATASITGSWSPTGTVPLTPTSSSSNASSGGGIVSEASSPGTDTRGLVMSTGLIAGIVVGALAAVALVVAAVLVLRSSDGGPLLQQSWEVVGAGGDYDGGGAGGDGGAWGARGTGGIGFRRLASSSASAVPPLAAWGGAGGGAKTKGLRHSRSRSVRRVGASGAAAHPLAPLPIGASSIVPTGRREPLRPRLQNPSSSQQARLVGAAPRHNGESLDEASRGAGVSSRRVTSSASARRRGTSFGDGAPEPPGTMASSTTAGSTTASLVGSGGSTGGTSTPSGSSMTGFSNPVSRRDTRAWAGEHGPLREHDNADNSAPGEVAEVNPLAQVPAISAVVSTAASSSSPVALARSSEGRASALVSSAAAAGEEEAEAVPPKAAAYDVISLSATAFPATSASSPPASPAPASRAVGAPAAAAGAMELEKSITISLADATAAATIPGSGRGGGSSGMSAISAAGPPSPTLAYTTQQQQHSRGDGPRQREVGEGKVEEIPEKMVVIGLPQHR